MQSDVPQKFPLEVVPPEIGAVISRERRALGWSQRRLAEAAGLRRETIIHLEAGRRIPFADTVFRIEAALDLEPGELVPKWPEWRPVGSPSCGARSRERRLNLGLSLEKVCASAGVGIATLSRFEREIGAPRSLAVIRVEEGMPTIVRLKNQEYARVLGFANAAAHFRWCVGPG